jgi:hypothetical protein
MGQLGVCGMIMLKSLLRCGGVILIELAQDVIRGGLLQTRQ